MSKQIHNQKSFIQKLLYRYSIRLLVLTLLVCMAAVGLTSFKYLDLKGKSVDVFASSGIGSTNDTSFPVFTNGTIGNCPVTVVSLWFFKIFDNIKANAQTSATASDCGIIYTPLQVTINQAATQSDPTPSSQVKFTAVFNQPVDPSTFTSADIVLTGTASGLFVTSITQIAPNNNTTFEVLVSATGNGTVIANIPQKTLTNSIQSANIDALIFNDTDSTSLDNLVTIINSDTSTYITIIVPPITNNPRPAITGTCEAGGLVTVTITTGSSSSTVNQILPPFSCPSTNSYSVTPTIDIPQGAYCIRSSIVDLAGNTATDIGCGDISITVVVPTPSTDNRPIIIGTCTASTASYQVPVSVVIRVGYGFGVVNETISTICTTTGIYSVRPNVVIAPGDFQVTATATDAVGNQAIAIGIGSVIAPAISSSSIASSSISTISSISNLGGIIIITNSSATPETFNNISDPYECGKSITGKVINNYDIKSVVVKLFIRRGDTSYEAEPKYIFRPTLDVKGAYEVKLDYLSSQSFTKGQYRVEYYLESITGSIRSGSYLANITDQCSQIVPTIILQSAEITPEGKVTVRTGGNVEVYYIALVIVIAVSGYFKLRRKDFRAREVFRK